MSHNKIGQTYNQIYSTIEYSVEGLAKLLMYGDYLAANSNDNSTTTALKEEVGRYPYKAKEPFKVSNTGCAF